MRNLVLATGLVLSCGVVFGQAMSDFGAVAAGSTVGGAAGKPVSNALSGALRGVDKATADAAQTAEKAQETLVKEPLVKETPLEVVPAVHASDLPHAPAGSANKALPSFKALTAGTKREGKGEKLPVPAPGEKNKEFDSAPVIESLFELPSLPEEFMPKGDLAKVLPTTPLAPPPVMTAVSFNNITSGMSRSELLRLGAPQFKVTMDEDGHLAELYSYAQEGQRVGSVKLLDGAVAVIRR